MTKPATKAIEALVESVIDETEGRDTAARLGALGYPKAPKLAQTFENLTQRFCTDQASIELFAAIIANFLNTPHPEGALLNLLRYTETAGSPNVLLTTLAQAGPLCEILATTFGSSQYMADIIIRNPGYLYWLIEKRTWEIEETTGFFETELERETSHYNTKKGKLNAVRRYHRMALLRIGVQDLTGQLSIEAVTERLSNLADAIVRVVLGILWHETEKPPQPNMGFAVLALGKLGGRELNYSSDIDLIYLCDDVDEETLSFYRTLAQALTEALSDITEESYLYRVDLRLRPDGVSGPLVNTMTSMRIYYENRGKPWEFQAMLKARAIAGDLALGIAFIENISNLIYNPSLPYSPVEDISHMRSRIQEKIPVRERPFNIKLMEGGIRDIEFIAQTLQLLHGSQLPDIRAPGTLEALARIHKQKLLKKAEVKTLTDAYRFLRLVEHRLQMMHQIKTHTVPESKEEVALLAARVSKGPLGTFSYDKFIQTLTKHLKNMRILSDSFFAGGKQEVPSLLFLLPEADAEARETLERSGITDPESAIKVIHTMAYGSFPRLLDRNTRAAFAGLLPHLLESVSETGDPGLTLANISRIAAAGKSEYTFYKLLSESEAARALVVAVAAISSHLTGDLCSRIEILDALLVDPEDLIHTSLAHKPVWKGLESGAKTGMDKDAAITALQNQLKQSLDYLHLAALLIDFKNRSFPDTLMSSRASFAKRSITHAFESTVGKETPAAVFAMGSFGVGEPRFGSDADLLVVTSSSDTENITRTIHTYNRVFTEGRIFKLDFRLRGEGANAPLVQDVRLYEQYFKKRMSLWERIAFSKCTRWWGDPEIAGAFFDTLKETLSKPFSKTEVESLALMRKKLEALAQKTGGTWETKRSPGGRYDIEYICGIGIARIAERETFPFTACTEERLRMLRDAGLISEKDFAILCEAITCYTRLEYLLELQGYSIPHSVKRSRYLEKYAERTFGYIGFPLRHGIKAEIKATKQAVRRIFDQFVEKASR